MNVTLWCWIRNNQTFDAVQYWLIFLLMSCLNVPVGWVTSWRKRNNSFLSLFDRSCHCHQPILFNKLTFTSLWFFHLENADHSKLNSFSCVDVWIFILFDIMAIHITSVYFNLWRSEDYNISIYIASVESWKDAIFKIQHYFGIKYCVINDCDWMKNGPSSKLIKSTSTAQNKRENCYPLNISFRDITTNSFEPWMRMRRRVWRWRWYFKCKEMHVEKNVILWPNIRYMSNGYNLHTSTSKSGSTSKSTFIIYELSEKDLITYDPLFEFWVPGVFLSGMMFV